jgi:hypothetical protein
MAAHVLRLSRDGVEPAARTAMPVMNRVLYLVEGALTVDRRALAVEFAWYGAGACATAGGAAGATVLRYELVKKDARTPGRPLLGYDIELIRTATISCGAIASTSGSAPKRCRIGTGAAACVISCAARWTCG